MTRWRAGACSLVLPLSACTTRDDSRDAKSSATPTVTSEPSPGRSANACAALPRSGRFVLAIAPRPDAKPYESPDQAVVYRVP